MSDWATPSRWAALRGAMSGTGLVREMLPVGDYDPGCWLGLDDASRLHLIIRVPDAEVCLPLDLNDITIRYVDCGDLVVDVAADAALEIIISPVFDSIISGCLDGRHPVEVIGENLEQVRKAFSRAGLEISENKQIGLVGELMVMLHIMIPAIGRRAVWQWSGPLSERHDFVGESVHVEVKSTTRSMDQHEISRLDQLRTQEGTRLLLVSVQLERSIGGAHTIATLRQEILERLGNDGPVIDCFERKLQMMGWHCGLVQSGTLLRFNPRSLAVFAVEGPFPRLPDDYIPPRGVVSVTYVINVAACPTLSPGEAMEILQGGSLLDMHS